MVDYTPQQILSANSNPVYKPEVDQTDKDLYSLMDNSDDSQDVTDYYTRSLMSMSTVNPYSGVLENPHKCDFEENNNDMDDIKDKINDIYNNGTDENGNKNSDNPDWQSNMNPNNPDGLWNNLFGDPYNGNGSPDPSDTSYKGDAIIDGSGTTVRSGLDLFQNHTNRMTFNLQSILGMVQAALGMASAIGNLLNPCTGLGDFFNSLMEKGKEWMATIKKYMKEIVGLLLLPALLTLAILNLAVKTLLDYIKQVKSWIKDEIKKLVNAIKKAIKNSLGNFLKDLMKDPCASFLIKTVTTTGAAYALSKI